MAERRDGRAVVVVNGAEGELASYKDRVLMASRPHLVIDGAVLAADAVGADDIVFYVGEEHGAAIAAMAPALEERRAELGRRSRLVTAPTGYVSGALPSSSPCRGCWSSSSSSRRSPAVPRGCPSCGAGSAASAFDDRVAIARHRHTDGATRGLGRRDNLIAATSSSLPC